MQPDDTELVEGEIVYERPGAELAVPTSTLFQTADPRIALQRMAEIAKEIVTVIDSQKLYVRISGKKYVTCTGWKTVGGMYGLSPYTVWTRPNENGDGYVARVEVRTLDERTIAAAEAECARDETHWKDRPKHSLRSMSETRATSRALRGTARADRCPAGFAGTPAEEMLASETEPAARPVGPSRPTTLQEQRCATCSTDSRTQHLRSTGRCGAPQPREGRARN